MTYRGGIDLGGTKIQAVIVDEASEVVGQARQPTPTKGSPADVAAEIANALREAAEVAGVETSALTGIGIGSPGKVDDDAGTVTGAMNLPGWSGTFDLRKYLEEACGAPVSLGNDVQVATDAEFELGAAQPYDSVLGVFWGTGVGGGIILDGKPWIGRDAAGEIGHVVVRMGGAAARAGEGMHGGVRGPARDGDPRAPRRRPRREDRAVQDHGGARPHAAHQRRLVARA